MSTSLQTQVGLSLKTQRILAMILLIAQGGITVTGAIVRVTGSGLGCNTWPNCHEGSLVPVTGAAPMVQQFIEFGNRLLTFVVAAAALAVTVAMYKAKRRKALKIYGWVSGFGIIAQAIIGGASVLVNLRWYAVALHFLPSMILVWVAALFYMRIAEPDDVEPKQLYPQPVRIMSLIAAICMSGVLITGTMVTGSGPHSGDKGVGMSGRLEVDTMVMTYIHASLLYLFLALVLVTAFMLYRYDAPIAAKKTAWVLLVLIAIQWMVGVAQVYMGVPRWTVPIHIGMSSLVVTFCGFLWANGRRRMPTLV